MTREEAIGMIRNDMKLHHDDLSGQYRQALNMAIEALKEQQPKKPHYTTLKYLVSGEERSVKHPECPKCFEIGFRLWDAEIEKGQAFCKRCGQAIDWSKDGEQE